MKRIAILVLVLLQAPALLAQVGEKERLDELRRRARELEARIPELRDPPAATLAGLPLPDLPLLRLAQQLRAVALEAQDLDLAPGLRLRTAAILRSVGDPAGALEEAKAVLDHPLAVPAQKIEARLLSARVLREGGGHAGAARECEALAAEQPEHRSSGEWRRQAEEDGRAAAAQAAAASELARDIRSGEARLRARADQALRRFLVANPLAPEAAGMLEALLAALGEEAGEAARLPIVERLALYAPEAESWPKALASAMQGEAKIGEYELALLFAHRMRMRPASFGSAELQAAEALEKQLVPLLARIAGRDLDLEPKTKRTRLVDLRRRIRRGTDPELLAETIEEFLADYPGAPERPEFELALARALETAAPERALALYRQAATRDRGGESGYEALTAAARIAATAEGPEAALALYASHAQDYADPRRGIPIALERARLLDQLDRWEEARKLLAPWKEKAQGLDRDALDKLDAELAAKIGG